MTQVITTTSPGLEVSPHEPLRVDDLLVSNGRNLLIATELGFFMYSPSV